MINILFQRRRSPGRRVGVGVDIYNGIIWGSGMRREGLVSGSGVGLGDIAGDLTPMDSAENYVVFS